MTIANVAGLLVWGTLVGVDLVSLPQIMIARPLVAGTVAGWLLGDPVTGLTVGAVLELFALEVLPVGAARYPDYGPAAVSAAAVAAGAGLLRGVGLAVAVGLVVAYTGEFTIQLVRRLNSEMIHRRADQLAEGEARAIRALHHGGLARNAARAALLTGAGLALAAIARVWPLLPATGVALLDVMVLGAGFAAAVTGAVRVAGSGRGLRWFAVGLTAGCIVAAALR